MLLQKVWLTFGYVPLCVALLESYFLAVNILKLLSIYHVDIFIYICYLCSYAYLWTDKYIIVLERIYYLLVKLALAS